MPSFFSQARRLDLKKRWWPFSSALQLWLIFQLCRPRIGASTHLNCFEKIGPDVSYNGCRLWLGGSNVEIHRFLSGTMFVTCVVAACATIGIR